MARRRKDGKPSVPRTEMTKTQKVLLHLANSGGRMRLIDMQKFVAAMNGHDWQERQEITIWVDGEPRKRNRYRWRSYWGEYLRRMLPKFCWQDPETREWVQNFMVGDDGVILSADGQYAYNGKSVVNLGGEPR